MSRFDYVQYDELASAHQALLKKKFQELEGHVLACLPLPGRAESYIFAKLEEAYMWIGKAIRDAQISRSGVAPLQESRGNE